MPEQIIDVRKFATREMLKCEQLRRLKVLNPYKRYLIVQSVTLEVL